MGNIPDDFNEGELLKVLAEVGRVLHFEIIYDKDMLKPQGVGCTYFSAGSALSAMNNLNGREFQGRTLRVDAATTDELTEHQLHDLPPLERRQVLEVRERARRKRGRELEREEHTLPPPKRQKVEDDDAAEKRAALINRLKGLIVKVVKEARADKASLNLQGQVIALDVLEELQDWARPQGYVLRQKVKQRRVDTPGSVRNEYDLVDEFVLNVYW